MYDKTVLSPSMLDATELRHALHLEPYVAIYNDGAVTCRGRDSYSETNVRLHSAFETSIILYDRLGAGRCTATTNDEHRLWVLN